MTHADLLPATARALEHLLASEQANSRLPSVVAGVVRDGATLWSGGCGEVGGAVPTPSTQYRIGSISKTFTAVLVLRLRDEGLLDLDDPVDKYLPGTAVGDRTIAGLLSHAAGLRAEPAGSWWERSVGGDWAELAAGMGEGTLLHRPGARFHYSNVGYGVLGAVVEHLRGRPWSDVLQREILEPLELSRTSYHPQEPHAEGYAVHPWADVLLAEPYPDTGAMAPAGQLWSTSTDLMRFATFLAGDTADVLRTDTLAEMSEPRVVEDGPEWTAAYGLGLQVFRIGGRRLIGHGGSMPGFLAGVLVDLDDRSGAVVLTNATAGLGMITVDVLRVVRESEPPLPKAWRPAASVDRDVLDIIGPWYWGPTALSMRLTSSGELHLQALAGRARAARFRRSGDDTWVGLDGYYAGETLRVVRGDDGSVNHLDIGTFIFTRQPYDPSAPIPGGVPEEPW
jgi:CubicO group peptidase (beta-lactamase class C family)